MDEQTSDVRFDAGRARRRDLKVKMLWAFAAKLLGLALLWFLFFRGRI